MALIFGFDIGTTSIGSAVIEHDARTSNGRILRLGVRIFPETRQPKSNAPLNQQRREKRMARRQLRRRRGRRRDLNDLLAANGLLPEFGGPEWDDLMGLDPYQLRARALNEKLNLKEIGRAIYHLAQRRHFKGRDLALSEDDESKAEEESMRDEARGLARELEQSGKTLGQWLSALPAGERRRGRHATRAIVEQEFDRIWESQASRHGNPFSAELRDAVWHAIFFQRPVFWRKNTLGECPLIPGAALCSRGDWISHQRRMLEKLNNLELIGAGARRLDDEERGAILSALQTQRQMTWAGVRRTLAPLYRQRGQAGEQKRLKFNLETGGERGLPGNPLEFTLAKLMGETWNEHTHQHAIRQTVHERLWNSDYSTVGDQRVVIRPLEERSYRRRTAAESIVKDFGLPDTFVDELAEISLPSGWEPFSRRALEKLLPELERGIRMGELLASPTFEDWRDQTFPERRQPAGRAHELLPSPADAGETKRLRAIRNPTVVRCQNELRKVVNNLIRLYGKPDLIRIELTRDVGRSKRDREEYTRAIRKRERERKAAENDLIQNGLRTPSRDDITKWLLWKECRKICPYTGDTIGFSNLFHDGEFDIEHIWPRSRCLDDSFLNKSLCRSDINKEKGNRTPWEYLGHDRDRWHAIQNRLTGMSRKKGGAGMSFGKVKRFLATEIPDGFVNRQLTDTGYAARESVSMLKQLWPDEGPQSPVRVQVVSGKITARLRKLWGLNNLLHTGAEKNRADHRHHAVDALVVACTRPGVVNELSRYWRHKEQSYGEAPTPLPPWDSIRTDASRVLPKVVVSHRPSRKITGALHEESHFSDTGVEIKRRGTVYRQFVRRKPVSELSLKEIGNIRDGAVREIITEWVQQHGGDPKKAFAEFPRLGPTGPEIRKVRVTEEKRPELVMPLNRGSVDKGKNHHLAIYQTTEGALHSICVSRNEAAHLQATSGSPVRRNLGNGEKLLFSVSPGDSLLVPSGSEDNPELWIVESTKANGQVTIKKAHEATESTKTQPMLTSLVKRGSRKVNVDPIGRVRPARD